MHVSECKTLKSLILWSDYKPYDKVVLVCVQIPAYAFLHYRFRLWFEFVDMKSSGIENFVFDKIINFIIPHDFPVCKPGSLHAQLLVIVTLRRSDLTLFGLSSWINWVTWVTCAYFKFSCQPLYIFTRVLVYYVTWYIILFYSVERTQGL